MVLRWCSADYVCTTLGDPLVGMYTYTLHTNIHQYTYTLAHIHTRLEVLGIVLLGPCVYLYTAILGSGIVLSATGGKPARNPQVEGDIDLYIRSLINRFDIASGPRRRLLRSAWPSIQNSRTRSTFQSETHKWIETPTSVRQCDVQPGSI